MKQPPIFRFNFKNILYFCIVCLLGFNLGITSNHWIHKDEEFNKGYLSCLCNLKKTSIVQFVNQDSIKLFIQVGEHQLVVPLKVITSR